MALSALMKPALLNNGSKMPRLGIGTFLLLGDKCEEIVTTALETGYRHVDTAYSYGNEKEVGKAVGQCIKSGHMKRSDVFITTKVPPVYLAPKDVSVCVEESLDNMQSQYLDLVLVHSPWSLKNNGDGVIKPVGPDGFHYEYTDNDLSATWSALEKSVRSGKVKSIGLSNCKESLIRKVVDSCRIKPQCLQLECHLYFQQRRLKQVCDELGIVCIAYSPLGAPGIPPHHTANLTNYQKVLDNQVVTDMAAKYGKTPGQILLRFILQQGFMAIPKTSSVKRLVENSDVFNFKIAADDMNVLRGQDRGMRYFLFPQYRKHPQFPREDEPY